MVCLNRGMKPKAVVAELHNRNRELAEYLTKQKIPLKKKTGFYVGPNNRGCRRWCVHQPFCGYRWPYFNMALSAFDVVPSRHIPNRLAPVAIFHDIEEKLSLTL